MRTHSVPSTYETQSVRASFVCIFQLKSFSAEYVIIIERFIREFTATLLTAVDRLALSLALCSGREVKR